MSDRHHNFFDGECNWLWILLLLFFCCCMRRD